MPLLQSLAQKNKATKQKQNKAKHVVGWLRERKIYYQSFQEAGLLRKPAATQQTQVQRLRSKNKGGFPYITFRAGYRNVGRRRGSYSLSYTWPHIISLPFWGKVTSLWSCPDAA
jgi:hypothetical protein